MVKGIIFDADGTLFDSTAMWLEAGSRYLKALGIDADPALGSKMFSMTLVDSATMLQELYQIPLTVEEIIDGINGTILEYYRQEVTLKPGVEAFLQAIHALGIPMTLATATDRVVISAGLEHTGIASYFTKILTCGEVGVGKDQPDIYLQAMEAMGSTLDSTWVFEDAIHGAKTAKQAGFSVVGVYDEVSKIHQPALKACVDYYLEDFHSFDAFHAVAK